MFPKGVVVRFFSGLRARILNFVYFFAPHINHRFISQTLVLLMAKPTLIKFLF
jgi:hypothetical protein